jgi:ATP-dependent Lon protease
MDNNLIFTEIQKLEAKLGAVQLPSELYEKAHQQLERLNLSLKYGGNVNQLDLVSKYFDWITAIPWTKKTEDTLDIQKAKEIMDKNHHGLEVIKKRILEYLSILTLQKKNSATEEYHAPVLFFVGLAGTGKTTFAKSIADSLGRKFIRIPFGGLSSALDLRGLSRVQMEAEPGALIKSICRVGVKNPVILLDELDRITPEARAAVMGVLIELLDPEQNSHFTDHYIDYPIDLSQVIFVATANNTQNISTAVMDRLEVIQMPSYSDSEKVVIAKNYILPRLLKESGIPAGVLTIEDVVWQKVARQAGFDPGIRSVERYAEGIVRKVAYEYVSGKATTFNVGELNMKDYIGGF